MGRGKAPKTRSGLRGEPQLRSRLTVASARLHPDPQALRGDAELFAQLVSLYGKPPRRIWGENLEPFLSANAEALQVLYREHRFLPEAAVLDLIEAPMVLERLDRDTARLQTVWPLDRSSLVVLADAWGRPVDHAA